MASLPPITINTEVSSCRGELRERHRHEGKLSGLNLTPMGQKINKITKVNSRVRDTGHHPALQALRILTNHTSHSPHQKLAIDIEYVHIRPETSFFHETFFPLWSLVRYEPAD